MFHYKPKIKNYLRGKKHLFKKIFESVRLLSFFNELDLISYYTGS